MSVTARARLTAKPAKLLAGFLLGTSTLCGASVAYAEEAADGAAEAPDTKDVIVVTAQRRTENLQDVPLSIQVLGNERLDQLQVSDFSDYVRFLPSVSTQEYGGPSYNLVYMRGVASGGDGNHSGPLPSVGTYLDEQPITTNQGNLNVHLYDIARVEALAGPQGTLYGASSQSGTIRIITNKPDPSGFSGAIDTEANLVDHGDFGGKVEGYINAPLAENAALRVVGWYVRDGGYIDNVRVPRTYPTSGATDDNAALVEDNFNDVETYGGRAALGIDLDENWTVTGSVMAQKQKSYGTFASQSNLGDLQTATYRADYQDDRWVQAALTIEGKIGNFSLTYAGAYLKRSIDGLSDYSDYSYFYDVLYGSGYYVVGDCDNPDPFDASCPRINPSQYFKSRDRFTLLSQELRIASPDDAPLRFVGGAFYQRQSHDIQQEYKIDNLADAISVPGWPDTIWLTKQDRVDRDYAIFGELSYDLTDQLTLTGGLRQYWYDNTLVGFFGYSANYSSKTGVAACFDEPVAQPGAAPCTNLGVVDSSGNISPRQAKDNGHIHRLNLTWKFAPEQMVYATWSRGFRPGGQNRRGGLTPYLADFLTNYEIGLKLSTDGGRLRWNTAVFQEDWDNFQFAVLAANGLTEIRNAAQARIRGIETDVFWRASPALTLTAGGSYIDAKLAENYCGEVDAEGKPITDCADPAAPDGTRLPATPKFKGNITARYEFPVSASVDAHFQIAGVYQSSIRSNLELETNRLIGTQPGYGTVDIATGLEWTAGWRAELFVTNLFDERGQAYLYAQCGAAICANDSVDTPGIVYRVPNKPRTFGIKLGYNF